MDEIDLKILRLLSADARVPFKKIAMMLGIGADAVLRRFRKLQKDGVIDGCTVVLSSKACGFKDVVGFFLELKRGAIISTVRSKLIDVPQIVGVWQYWGNFELYAEALLRELAELHDLISTFRKIEGIARVYPFIYEQQDWSIPFLPNYILS